MPTITAFKTSGDGRDANGIRVGEWEAGLCGCFTHCVPNCLMATCLPFISVAQISSRLEIFKYSTVLLVTLFTYALLLVCCCLLLSLLNELGYEAVKEDPNGLSSTIGPTTTKAAEKALGTIAIVRVISAFAGFVYFLVLFQLRAKTRERFELPGNCCTDCCISCCCSCCSIAQIATHVKSYKPGSCDFGPADTLPPYA